MKNNNEITAAMLGIMALCTAACIFAAVVATEDKYIIREDIGLISRNINFLMNHVHERHEFDKVVTE